MPIIADTVSQLAVDGLPVLFIDTCILLDIIRAPQRKLSGCVRAAVELAEMQDQSICRIVASSMIQKEWETYQQKVIGELNDHLELRDQDAVAFHEACDGVQLSISFGKPSYESAGLAVKLRDLSAKLLSKAVHLLPSDETKSKATDRTLSCIRPARKGGGLQDCIIIEEYLEVSRLLQAAGFSKKRVFCTSNAEDYQDGRQLHKTLADEFSAVGLVFTNSFPWLLSELNRTT